MTLRERAAQKNGATTSEVATTNGQPGIAGFIQRCVPEIERALPRHLNADRLARLALTEVRKTPKLGACTPQSFAGALLTAAALGLEVGTTGEAYLVPYEHRRGALAGTVECQLQVGYQGYTKLFYQHPLAADIDAQAVHEHDDFDFTYGTAKFLRHRPARGDRGPVIYYYAVAELSTGASHFVVLTPDEVKVLRGGKTGPSGNIDDPQRWMERKTAIRQCLKMLPKSTTLSGAIVAEDRTGTELYRDQVAQRELDSGPAAAPADEAGTRQQGTAAAASADEPPPPWDDNDPWAQRMITDDQSKKLHACLGDLSIVDRDQKLEYIGGVIGRPVTTSKELTLSEASQVIEALTADANSTSADGAP